MSRIKKLIEVALPLDAINEASAREKSIRHGHPSTLHLWWARRPLATARAVIFASLVDAPSSHPELFKTKEEQDKERKRLFGIIERLVQWENINDKELFDEAYAEIKKYCGDEVPTLLDPFAGGGAIPLEAQRLGLKAVAADLNPVAVMINKAMIEIPPRFVDMPPVNPKDRAGMLGAEADWHGAQGLAADVRYYGELLKQKAYEKIGHLYPKVKNPETGEDATVIAWIWARTVKCPNPACGCEMPLTSSFVLSKKENHEIWIDFECRDNKLIFSVKKGNYDGEKAKGTKIGKKATFRCPVCQNGIVKGDYVDNEAGLGNVKSRLMAIVAQDPKGKIYISPNVYDVEENGSKIRDYYIENDIDNKIPNEACRGTFASNAQGRKYGFNEFKDYFTKRQLATLTTFNDLISEIQDIVRKDAIMSGMLSDGKRLEDNGNGGLAYSQAISVYLAFLNDKLADYNSSLCGWNNNRDGIRSSFGQQGISMAWDYAEANPFSNATGSYENMIVWIEKALKLLPVTQEGKAIQSNASIDNNLRNVMISTDPPYYSNIGYADLSDFFYVWSRRSLRNIYPDLLNTLLVPKREELVADAYRFSDKDEVFSKNSDEIKVSESSKLAAKKFFESGMSKVCSLLLGYTRKDIPITIYYAFKQNDAKDGGMASSGWETMLSAVINAGFSITGTWPVRTEKPGRNISNGTNALASSIVLVCRKRETTNQVCSRKDFIRQLRSELNDAIEKLQSASIAPVDMMQSAIGPGISVYSRYDHVIEADGSEMSVRTALQIINQELDAFFGGQSEGLDAESRFAVELFAQAGFDELDFGTADVLARAKNTSVAKVADTGAIISGRGKVRLAKREEMEFPKAGENSSWMNLQRMAFAMEREGIRGCAKLIMESYGSNDVLKNLAYHMYQLAEEKHLSSEAGVYNNLVISWNDILAVAEELRSQQPEQMNLLEV